MYGITQGAISDSSLIPVKFKSVQGTGVSPLLTIQIKKRMFRHAFVFIYL